ncbi:MarR family winged helix-turn-helix transcriptional regulator [Burkholderia sp. L27(2015)]|jgi:DNA-binding MarR family transcriptional regulator|uniref:MarR family winged helix-turn-helix transcriptional regulator n=1 Tax=Burkholderia sp. L27(2015) TaxID=1641858 RepID=UPI00131AA736|nr:MarR family winged helix-turn-helix transcriptional regulator [Burkholderia sp. L27(2015)]
MTDAPPSSPAMKAPRDIEDFLIYRLHQLGLLARRGAGAMYARELGISRREWRVLSFLAKYSGCNLTDLARNSGIDTVVASRCVSEMVTLGLVAKAREPGNKRITVLTLTPHGQSVYDRALALGRAYNAAFAACLSDTEASLLDDLLGRLEARALTMNAGEGDADPVDAD